jgi:hypothetical protein
MILKIMQKGGEGAGHSRLTLGHRKSAFSMHASVAAADIFQAYFHRPNDDAVRLHPEQVLSGANT